MDSQRGFLTLLSRARLSPYLAASGGDLDRAANLYLWATELAGALHAQISFVELAVRNALDPHLSAWNAANGGSPVWTDPGAAQCELYTVLGGTIAQARARAEKEAALRKQTHPRHGTPLVHDDVIAQMMFGSWVKVLTPLSRVESSMKHQKLWRDQLHHAFPRARPGDSSRAQIGHQLDAVRYLRNRVAHHDNLLTVNVRDRLNEMLSVLSKIDGDHASLAMARSSVRRLAREDPRREW